jgi:hypothetical protein
MQVDPVVHSQNLDLEYFNLKHTIHTIHSKTEELHEKHNQLHEKIDNIPQPDLSEFATKEYVDEKIEDIPPPDLTETLADYVLTSTFNTKIADYALSSSLADYAPSSSLAAYMSTEDFNNQMFYEGDPSKDLRIKYAMTGSTGATLTHDNNVYLGGKYNGTSSSSDFQNTVIGSNAEGKEYRSTVMG